LVWCIPRLAGTAHNKELFQNLTDATRMAETETAPAGGYQFPMVRYTDMEEEMKKEVGCPSGEILC
jgi:hypothetical protein